MDRVNLSQLPQLNASCRLVRGVPPPTSLTSVIRFGPAGKAAVIGFGISAGHFDPGRPQRVKTTPHCSGLLKSVEKLPSEYEQLTEHWIL